MAGYRENLLPGIHYIFMAEGHLSTAALVIEQQVHIVGSGGEDVTQRDKGSDTREFHDEEGLEL
jgi:hypothetical protein